MKPAIESNAAQLRPLLITELIDRLTGELAPYGLRFKGHTALSVSKYRALPPIVQKQIFAALSFALELVASAPDDTNYESLDVYMLKKACQTYNLHVPDRFIRQIGKGDIVEIYDLKKQTQIYRNFEFLRSCSYDLLTVCVTPYPELFDRESGFDEQILQRTKEVTEHSHGTEPWNVPNHHLVERLASNQRKFFLKLGNIAPVYSTADGSRIAWASTIQVVNLGSSFQNAGNVVPL